MDEDAYPKQEWCDCGHPAVVKVTICFWPETDLDSNVLDTVQLCQCCANQELDSDTFQLGPLKQDCFKDSF
jgi:hypothetical protein